ncbi:hypothetical protein [Pseudomonas aeruginosa]|uniref:hypothetical protein n=1 Tax=Pseudomonas aeruginosa TaxID=287 RepID=UPI000B4958F6|nr:hypothetical protein [Pseudomonas aeruginosa]EIU3098425.1 hypothetical protein [Pseudomonas aeruginosa]MCK1856649.1 hypothetical protein [Pseudomonas aeruginosa]MCK1868881.1 hypothetical protein [Pseudomonas aeruginosa]MCK1874243.1 hypothetical protein [Pseudomonas aeruginosa]MCK1887155.1 hypothetical protein [Pseudomonas aeruginosa]
MRNLTRVADQVGNNLSTAGIALETIANLLGADGCEHHLDSREVSGLLNAVSALSAYISGAGYDLCSAVEEECNGGAE